MSDKRKFWRPSEAYKNLYDVVEMAAIFSDSKTFPDMTPIASPQGTLQFCNVEKSRSDFDLRTFVNRHFSGPKPPGPMIRAR